MMMLPRRPCSEASGVGWMDRGKLIARWDRPGLGRDVGADPLSLVVRLRSPLTGGAGRLTDQATIAKLRVNTISRNQVSGKPSCVAEYRIPMQVTGQPATSQVMALARPRFARH